MRSTAPRRQRPSSGGAACAPSSTGDDLRIFEAVVRPERVKTDGNADAEVERLRKEIARAEGMLANERFTSKAPAEVVEAERREARALSP